MPARQTYENALILGLGRSGEAATRLLLAEGTRVTAIDCSDSAELRQTARDLESRGATVLLGCEAVPGGEFSVCVVSPGVPADSEWIRSAESCGSPALSELELGWSRCGGKMVAITGSNGKSTLAKLCLDALISAGRTAELVGNYGRPISDLACSRRYPDWVVVEVSSFQLERVVEFKPCVGVLLNILPNHLDRHGDMETYVRTKSRLFARMDNSDTGVVPLDMVDDISRVASGRGRLFVTFGTSERADYTYDSGRVLYRAQAGETNEKEICSNRRQEEAGVSFEGTIFDNDVLGLTAAASVAVVRACGLSTEHVASAAKKFRGLPHRMQEIGEIRGIRFVDDSKATNLAAMCAALRMSARPVRLIAGGRLKEEDLTSGKELLAQKVVCVYLIGEATEAMAASWRDVVACERCDNLAEAVERAWKEACAGELVLLSPACASFDQFSDFEERGNQFKAIVSSLAARN